MEISRSGVDPDCDRPVSIIQKAGEMTDLPRKWKKSQNTNEFR